MKVKLAQAVKMFFGNSSLEMVYFEALANSLDAGATKIEIKINIAAFNKPDTLKIEIIDDGEGFTDFRFNRFSKLFDTEESSHKGLGRLVYLCYFENVSINSYYEKTNQRKFEFNEDFDEDLSKTTKIEPRASGTTIIMNDYTFTKVKQYSYLKPLDIKNRILEEFYSRLFQLKQDKKTVSITISLNDDGRTTEESLTLDDVSELKMVEFQSETKLFDVLRLYYSIDKVEYDNGFFIAALSVDNRTMKMDILAKENEPMGYKMVFLLFSDWFEGKVDHARQFLTIPEKELRDIQNLFRQEVVKIIEQHVPKIAERNMETKESLNNRYPHLTGYFDEKNIGYVSRDDIIKKAQNNFFKAQKEILEAQSLSDEQYNKAIELSARALTEYILFRQITIEKLKKISNSDNEAIIHNLIVPKYKQFDKSKISEDLYRNNAWVLDDKYMTYETILSDKQMMELVDVITDGEYKEDDIGQPDIALIFSNDPYGDKSVDVVIVELKKKGITLEENMKVETQLESRARRLMKHYNNKIQRIWFYGVVEFNQELELHLSGEYTELYSTGKMFYKPTTVAIQLEPLIKLPIGIFILDLDSVINDANARNSTFLNLIKSKFQ